MDSNKRLMNAITRILNETTTGKEPLHDAYMRSEGSPSDGGANSGWRKIREYLGKTFAGATIQAPGGPIELLPDQKGAGIGKLKVKQGNSASKSIKMEALTDVVFGPPGASSSSGSYPKPKVKVTQDGKDITKKFAKVLQQVEDWLEGGSPSDIGL